MPDTLGPWIRLPGYLRGAIFVAAFPSWPGRGTTARVGTSRPGRGAASQGEPAAPAAREHALRPCGGGAVCRREDGALRLAQTQVDLGAKDAGGLKPRHAGSENVRLAIWLRLLPDGRLGLGLSLGQERLYAIRSLPELLACYTQGLPLPLSPLSYLPTQMRFAKEDERLLSILLAHIRPKAPQEDQEDPREEEPPCAPPSEGRYVLLSGAFLQSILRYLETHPFTFLEGSLKQPHGGIRTVELPLCFTVSLALGELEVAAEGIDALRLITPDARCCFARARSCTCTGFRQVCQLLTRAAAFAMTPPRRGNPLHAAVALSTNGRCPPGLSAAITALPPQGVPGSGGETWKPGQVHKYEMVLLLTFRPSGPAGGALWRKALRNKAPSFPCQAQPRPQRPPPASCSCGMAGRSCCWTFLQRGLRGAGPASF